jgi:predicted nucleic acid-binding protein
MNAIDTNVLIYRLDRHEPVKRSKARALLRHLRKSSDPTLLLWQVVTELLRHLRSWQSQNLMSRTAVGRYVDSYRRFFALTMPAPQVLDRALDLGDRHSLSHWDSMLVAACLEAGANRLYTENIGSPRKIDSLELINPFI